MSEKYTKINEVYVFWCRFYDALGRFEVWGWFFQLLQMQCVSRLSLKYNDNKLNNYILRNVQKQFILYLMSMLGGEGGDTLLLYRSDMIPQWNVSSYIRERYKRKHPFDLYLDIFRYSRVDLKSFLFRITSESSHSWFEIFIASKLLGPVNM